jgi:prephenate dehydratase
MTSAAIQGVRGAFSHLAAVRALGDAVEILECRTFDSLFEAVADGSADRGLVPVENTLAGAVPRNMDLLLQKHLHAVGEVSLQVRLCLAVPPGRSLEDIQRVASHPVALQQCHSFFRRHARFEPVPVFDTAGSVCDLMDGAAEYDAAIGSAFAASLYGATVLESDLQDHEQNFTRFLVMSREPVEPVGDVFKTSLTFTVDHRPGSLSLALGVFADAGINITRLESRPIPGRPGEYSFYADLGGAPLDDQDIAVARLRSTARAVRVIGRYATTP